MMNKEEKVKAFEKELSYIKNEEIKHFVSVILENVPDYFFSIPASSTGKYHPKYALGEGGLLRHTRAAVRIAVELFNMHDENDEFTIEEKDIIIASLILHDSVKNGFNESVKFTDAKHPIYATKLIESVVKTDERFDTIKDRFFEAQATRQLMGCIGSHMGKWTKDYKTKAEILIKPRTKMEKFVHLADYLASRKCLEMNFEV